MTCLRFLFAAEGLVLIVHFNTKATCERESETKGEAWFLLFVFAPNSVFRNMEKYLEGASNNCSRKKMLNIYFYLDYYLKKN